MRIGLTYDLRDDYLAAGYSELETAEFDRADTIDALDAALQELGYRTDRIGHARNLVSRLTSGERWDLIFNICEGLCGPGRESQVPAILELFDIPFTFADSCVTAVCLHKGLTKAAIRDAGIPTPRSVLIRDLRDLDSVSLNYPLFAKPVAEGTSKGVTPSSRVLSPGDLFQECERLLQEYQQPVLVEEFLPGREFTVGIIGTGTEASVLGTLEIHLRAAAEPEIYSWLNKEHWEDLVAYQLANPASDPVVRETERLALAAWQVLGGRDAGRIDMRCDALGQPQFIEANPLAGLHPQRSDLPMIATAVGLPYVRLIQQIIDSAVRRRAATPSDPRRSRLAAVAQGYFS